jgi:PPM family protein phosphatase
VAIPRPDRAGQGPCPDCGNEAHADGYCTVCGRLRAEPDRDEAVLGDIAMITDRGIDHARNEDAAAAGILDGVNDRPLVAAVAVCDGVSSSSDAHLASTAASIAGVEAMLTTLLDSGGPQASMLAGLAGAARAAAATDTPLATAASCTYTAVIVAANGDGPIQITVGNVGDGRAYWLPEAPAVARQLTVDDSLAQELITAGAAPDAEIVQRGAHTLTRWLGADSESTPWSPSSVQTVTVDAPGTLLLCSDGLWNYLPEAEDIRTLCGNLEPAAAASALTDFALRAGGQDNITVVVIPIGGHHEFG